LKRVSLVLLLILLCSCIFAQPVKKNPNKAVLYSIIPGGGQIYNKAYIKAGAIIGIQTYLIATAIHNDAKVQDYRDKINSTGDEILLAEYRDKQKEYREKRTRDFWWMGLTLAFSTLDAYIDAHLSNFKEEKEKIHIRFEEETLLLEYNF